jgi:hypothetical protein
MHKSTVRQIGALMLAFACAGPITALAQGKVRIAEQFGLSYLPLLVALELRLIEKTPGNSARLTPMSRSCV